ncbi:hypothetical protein ABE096_12405 [Robertmurraya massiliosenegalensis]|uniref:hypothetical protein n=1 Tax=Robertmurraya TaxID=2837507 RepID=UPI0039A6587F
MRLAQINEDERAIYYLEVEPEYVVPEEGKGQDDAVSFVMFQDNENGHEIDAVVTISVEDARVFAAEILKVCVQIE